MLEDLKSRLRRARKSSAARWVRWQVVKAAHRLAPTTSNSRARWEGIYSTQDTSAGRKVTKLMRLVATAIPPGASVLEVGCGAGVFLRHLVERGHPRVLGLDYSTGVVEKLQAEGLPAEVHDLTADAPLPTGFDVVVCLEVLEHFADPFPIYEKLWAAAGKRLLISVPFEHRVPAFEHLYEFSYPLLVDRLKGHGPVSFVGGHPAYIICFQDKAPAA